MAEFEGKQRRMQKINECLKKYSLSDLDEAMRLCRDSGIDVESIVKDIQPIAFENAVWAYALGTAVAIRSGAKTAEEAAICIGEGLQAFTVPGSVAERRSVGTGHGNLAAMLLREETKCFCLLAGHESFAAAEGGIGIVKAANKVRKTPLRVILNGLGKDAGYTLARMNGFTYMETKYDFATGELHVLGERPFSKGERANVRVYCSSDVQEAIEVMKLEHVDVSITGNSANAIRFQHLVAGTYKNWAQAHGIKYFSVASGGGTGRTLHPDNIGAGPCSYGITDSVGRMHGDVQFAGSSSVPAHVEMMGLMGMGNNPMVGATVTCAVAVAQRCN
ncbi:MAG: GGGtGRT protein [Eubacteriales bacterium]|nr:GGGtGRT protein [Eubacteriales bacterium]